jgi:hypothetical protein
MHWSLTLLAAEQLNEAGEAQQKSRLIRLARRRSLLPMTKAVSFAAIVLTGVAQMLVMAATGSGFRWYGYVIESLILLAILSAVKRNFMEARHDPLRLWARAGERCQFAEAKITGHEVRTVGSGSQSYEVIDATVAYHAPGHHGRQKIVETFDKTIWNFEPGQYPILARVVIDRQNPDVAFLIGISKSAIDAIPEGKKRNASGYGFWFALAIFLFVCALWFLMVSLMMLAEKFGFKVR